MLSAVRREGNSFIYERDGKIVSTLQVSFQGNRAVLHQQVYIFDRAVLCEMRGYFEEVKAQLRTEGAKQVMAITDKFTPMIGKYWRLMGFEFQGQVRVKGILFHFAVMEA